ncbi:MAG: radical SAM protein [Bacillota bacterium]|jgi:7-carboxy-7-deazaguanine synthase
MQVSEIFNSIEGEGIRCGYLTTFIRLYGCNLHCSYCDTRYSCQGNDFTIMTPAQIVEKVARLKTDRVTLTGGEPLWQTETPLLLQLLTEASYEVNIETNGSINISPYTTNPMVIITMDYKLPQSGMINQMEPNNLRHLREQDVLKFVVSDTADLWAMKKLLDQVPLKCHIFISPAFGQIELAKIVKFMKEQQLHDCRLQIQLHKIIWDPDQRGV